MAINIPSKFNKDKQFNVALQAFEDDPSSVEKKTAAASNKKKTILDIETENNNKKYFFILKPLVEVIMFFRTERECMSMIVHFICEFACVLSVCHEQHNISSKQCVVKIFSFEINNFSLFRIYFYCCFVIVL